MSSTEQLAIAKIKLLVALEQTKVPKMPLVPIPSDFRDLRETIWDVLGKVDEWVLAYGWVVKENATCNIDISRFTNVCRSAVEGDALHEIDRAAEVLAEDMHESAA